MIEAPIPYQETVKNKPVQVDEIKEVKHPLIGTEVYPVTTDVTSRAERNLVRARALIRTPDAARGLAFRMHNNSPTSAHRFGTERPASAYFTLMDNQLLVEWGQIDTDGKNKLHDFLNRELDTPARAARGAVVRSGHINNVSIPGGFSFRVALMDSLLEGQPVDEDNPNYPLVTSLVNARFVVVDSGGNPVKITKKEIKPISDSSEQTEQVTAPSVADTPHDDTVNEEVLFEPSPKLPKITSGLGEKQFGHEKRRFIISTEKSIAKGRKAITDIENERTQFPTYVEKGLMTPEEMTRKNEILLFHRKWISSEQTAMRGQIRPMKKYRKVED